MMTDDTLIPKQVLGSEMNAQAFAKFDNLEDAISFYTIAANRLKSIDKWSVLCGSNTTTFKLLDPNGEHSGEFEVGSIIKIDIPGPGTHLGSGYDWVSIEQIADLPDEHLCGFRVRPCPNPEKELDLPAHFFTKSATSTFLVRLYENQVVAEVHGRNEEPNTHVPDFFDGLRNMAVGYGAKIGLSYPQWKKLVEGIVNTNGY